MQFVNWDFDALFCTRDFYCMSARSGSGKTFFLTRIEG